MRIIRPCSVTFVDDKVEKSFLSLKEDDEIKIQVYRAIDEIKKNAFCGIPVPKKLIPREYVKKYEVTNLWKYDLPSGWRLVYSVTTESKIEIVSLILEWFNHKDYERRFKYG